MKSFFKKLAFVMALALVLGTTAQAGTAKAAEAWKFQKDSKILYLNEDNSSKTGSTYDFNFAKGTLPANWKDTLSFAWGSSDTKVATVAKGGVVTAVSVGTTTISCTVTEKATGKVVATAEAVVTVKENAADIEITNADKYDNTTVAIGDVVDLDRAMYNAAGQKTTKRGTLVTDYTKWVAEPAEGVTINQNNGQYTFTKAGTYTLYAYTYQSKTNDAVRVVSDKVVVTVADAGFEVAQKTPTKVQLTFAGEVTDINKDNVSVFMLIGETEVKVDVATVKVLDSKVDVAVETYVPFIDGYSYVVKFGENEETFKASVGKVAAVILSTELAGNVAYVEKDAKINATYLDANGIDITSLVSGSATFEWDYESSDDFYFDEGTMTIYFYEAGKVATLKGTYISGDVDDNGNAINNVPTSITVVSQKAPAVTVSGLEKWSFKSTAGVGYDAVNNNSLVQKIAEEDADAYLNVITKDSAGNKLASGVSYTENIFTFKSSNEEVALVDPDTGLFTPVAAGNVTVIVYYAADTDATARALGVINVTVSPKRSAKTIAFDQDTAVLAYDPIALADGTTEADALEVGITVKDGLGEDFAASLSKDGITTGAEDVFDIVGGKLTIDPTKAVMTKDGKVGSAAVTSKTFTVTVKADNSISRKFTLTVRKATTTDESKLQYKVVLGGDTDTTIKADKAANKAVTVQLFGYSNNVKVLEQPLVFKNNTTANDTFIKDCGFKAGDFFYTITKGSEVQSEQVNDTNDSTFTLTKLTSTSVSGTTVDVVSKKGTATYVVTVYKVASKTSGLYASKVSTASGSFTVTDAQPAIALAKVDKVVTSYDDVEAAILDCFKFSVGGNTVADDTIATWPIEYNVSPNGNKLYVKDVTLYVPVEAKEGTVYIKQTISIKKTITIGQ